MQYSRYSQSSSLLWKLRIYLFGAAALGVIESRGIWFPLDKLGGKLNTNKMT